MGRKIPGKKHRTVKDPAVQKAKREASLQGKINNPPTKKDQQDMPKSLLRVMALKEKTKQGLFSKIGPKKKKGRLLSVKKALDKDEVQPGMKRPERFIPDLEQRRNESVGHFAKRVDYMTKNIMKEVKFEETYGVEIKKDMKTGRVLNVQKSQENHKNSKSKKKKLSEKRKEKMEKKKAETNIEKDFSSFKDEVKFGERVDRPPVNLPKIKVRSQNVTDMLRKERIEIQRQSVVDQYRRLKKRTP